MLINDDKTAVLLVGAEGCSEQKDAPWWRDATDEEKDQFVQHVWEKNMAQDKYRRHSGPPAAHYSDCCVDGNNRPYWLKAVDLTHPELPQECRDKAVKYDRCVRLEW